jgi:protein-L-isoaspartate(D-aspartate) O-methyltransferase
VDDRQNRVAPAAIAQACEPFESIATAELDPLLRRIGEARVVLIGEASHGTSEFYGCASASPAH